MSYPIVTVKIDVSGNALSVAPTWTDITSYVCHDNLSVTWGRSRGADDFQPGSGSFSLINTDGRFDPTLTTGPYYGEFGLRTRVLIQVAPPSAAFTNDVMVGYITRLEQRWNHRSEMVTAVSFTDLLGVLATLEMPESAWDYVIAARTGKVAWFKPGGDTTSTAKDWSGLNRHGRYVTYEGYNGPYEGSPTPRQVVQAGVTDSVIPGVDRPSRSWAKMIAEADQPSWTSNNWDNWRATALIADQSTESLADPQGDCTIECWVAPRGAYALTENALTTGYQTDSGLAQWGSPPFVGSGAPTAVMGPWIRYGWRDSGLLMVTGTLSTGGLVRRASNSTGAVSATPNGNVGADTNEPRHLVVRRTGSMVEFFIDGVATNNKVDLSLSSFTYPRGFPLVLGVSNGFGQNLTASPCAWWSTLGDVVIYNRALTAGEITESYIAGLWGRIDSVADTMTAGEAIDQAATFAALSVSFDRSIYTSADSSHRVSPGPWNRKSVLAYMRELAGADAAGLYVESTFLMYQPNTYPVADAQTYDGDWLVSDDGTTTGFDLGHSGVTLSLDDSLIANDVTVQWVGGSTQAENTTSIARYSRFRRSISTPLSLTVEAQGRAEFEVWRRANPVPDIGSITIEPTNENEWREFASPYWGQPLRVIVTRPDGTKIDGLYSVESVRMEVAMGQGPARLTLGMTPAEVSTGHPGAPFIIDTSLVAGVDLVWY